MIFLFTTRSNLMSWLIRTVTGEPVSHFAILFHSQNIVLHSVGKGVSIEWFDLFKRKNKIIYALKVKNKNISLNDLYKTTITKYIESKYDLLALAFYPIAIISKKIFGFNYKKNLWGQSDQYICTEMLSLMDVPLDIPENLDLLTPGELYNRLKDRPEIEEMSELL